MDAVLHVPNWQEHGALLSVCPADKTCSQLPHSVLAINILPLAPVCQP